MAQPERAEDDAPPPNPTAKYLTGGPQPDWLVGAEEGMQAELESSDKTRPMLPPAVNLQRPMVPETRPAPPPPARRVLVPPPIPEDPVMGAGFERGAQSWTRAPDPAPDRSPAPPPRAEAPEEVSRPPFAVPEHDDRPAPGPSASRTPRRGPPPRVAELPWPQAALEQLRTDRSTQLVAAGAFVVLLTFCAFIVPRPSSTVPLSWLRRSPEKLDGRFVHVKGEVGDVFPVGGGFAFYLTQGGDTIVVFTRGRAPEPRHHVSVAGTLSTGYLDGAARLALFEEVGR